MKRMKFKTRRKRTPPYFSREPKYPSKLFNFGIKRFGSSIGVPFVEIIQNSLIVILYSSGHGGESLELGFLDFPIPQSQPCVSDIFPPDAPEDLSQL